VNTDPAVSIALCTFQGEGYLGEQLESLMSQTRHPDEVVVGDDGSTDGTLDLLRRFRERAPFPVDVHVNPTRLGAPENFGATMGRCRGDVILLCDQDDVWVPEKVERLARHFTGAARPALVFSDGELIDEHSAPLAQNLWKAQGVSTAALRRIRKGDALPVLCRQNVVTGATTAVDATYRDLLLPIPPGWMHDAWMALVMSCVATVQMDTTPLIEYRVHGSQQIGVPVPPRERRRQVLRRLRKQGRPRMADEATRIGDLVARLHACAATYPVRPRALDHLQAMRDHLLARARLPQTTGARRRWRVVARETARGRYHRFSNGWSSVVKDVFLLDELMGHGSRP
jgi:glycosyltransferase involved in cell wall biosynthesis